MITAGPASIVGTSGVPASGISRQVPRTPSHAHEAPASPGGMPAGSGEQVPARPGSTQLSHAPWHAVLQHTPPAQTAPMLHWSLRVQGVPRLPVGTQRPISQR